MAPGDRVLGCYHSACGTCFFCLRGAYHKCDRARVFGHGELLGDLPGTQAERTLVPMANLTLRRVPESVSDEVALFAGDVMGTGYHAVTESGDAPGDSVAVLGLGPVGLCAVQVAVAAGAGPVIAIDTRGPAPRDGPQLRRHPRPSERGEPARRRALADRGARSRRRRSMPSGIRTRSIWPSAWPARPAPCSRSASTPSPARFTWGWSGSRR